jgi:hypothetical protein
MRAMAAAGRRRLAKGRLSPGAVCAETHDPGSMAEATVTWVGGVWWLQDEGEAEPIADEESLDSWLSDHDTTRADLRFASQSLRERFVLEFGPLPA